MASPQGLGNSGGPEAHEAWGTARAFVSRQKIIQLFELGVRMEEMPAGVPAQVTPVGLAMFLAKGRKGPSGRVLGTYLSVICPGPPLPHILISNSSQPEYLLLYFVDPKTHFSHILHLLKVGSISPPRW